MEIVSAHAAELLVLGVSLGVGATSPWCGLGSGSCKSLVWITEWEMQVLGVVDLGGGIFNSWCGSRSGSCKSSVCIWEWELQVLGVVDLGVGVFSSWCGRSGSGSF